MNGLRENGKFVNFMACEIVKLLKSGHIMAKKWKIITMSWQILIIGTY